MAAEEVDRCRYPGCAAKPVAGVDACWGHAADNELSRLALPRLRDDARFDAAQVEFTKDRLELVLNALSWDASGRRTLQDADFTGATFRQVASFHRIRFVGGALFDRAVFEGSASFVQSVFDGSAWFSKTEFPAGATFHRTTFAGTTWFEMTRFATASFTKTTFEENATFQDASFSERGDFAGVTFGADLTFTGVTSTPTIGFEQTTFTGSTSFDEVNVTSEATFERCVFRGARQFGRIESPKLDLGRTVWHEPARIEAVADEVVLNDARFLSGAHIRLRRAAVSATGADLEAPSTLTSFAASEEGSRPRLTSLSGADVAGLSVSDLDLRQCAFAGAHHLNQLRIGNCDLATAPGWWRTRRRVIVEEQLWRIEHSSAPWSRDAWVGALDPAPDEPLHAQQIAGLYRELRKGLEDAKDEPGAADFYYGEMEMRRLGTRSKHRDSIGAAGEHVILTLYWLVAGYGLRAWRAFAGLGLLLVAAGVAFARWGIDDARRDDLQNGLLVSGRAATAGLTGSDVPLTTLGAWLQLSLRLLGPVLLGLALLSIRGRVRR